MQKKSLIIGLTIIIAAIIIFGCIFIYYNYFNRNQQVYCTQDAKLCPDGSYVGRTGPNCEFAPCKDITFQYPEELFKRDINVVDWPPQVQVLDEVFACTEAGSENDRAGKTESRIINNREYCVTEVWGAAAGSAYIQYAYAFPKNGKVVIFTFSLRFSDCGNYGDYDDPDRVACEEERESFSIDSLVDQIAQTLLF